MKAKVKKPQSLFDFLSETISTASATKVRRMVKQGRVTVNGEIVTRSDHKLKPGLTIELHKQKKSIQFKKAKQLASNLNILFEDKAIIAVVKPSGQIAAGKTGPKNPSLIRELENFLAFRDKSERKLFIVQRLDRDVSGISIFAKSEHYLKKIRRNWKDSEKRYCALVHKKPGSDNGKLEAWLERKRTRSVLLKTANPNATRVALEYKLLKSFRYYTLLELRPETEEKHQIRIQLSEEGCSIVGDMKYGSTEDPFKRLALHLHYLQFIHPESWKPVKITTPYPPEFSRLGKNTGRD